MRWGIVLLVGLAGCPGPAPSDDAPVDMAPPQSATLHVTWNPRPDVLPGDVNSSISVDRVTFGIDSLRVVGDAGPGDPRTSIDHLKLEWDSSDKPDAITFDNAPPGLYSRMEWLLDTRNLLREDDPIYVFEIVGDVDISGSDEKFRLRETAQLPISFDIQADLLPPNDATIDVRVDVERIVTAVDFESLPKVDGERLLDHGDPQMPAIRAKVVEAFSKDDSATR